MSTPTHKGRIKNVHKSHNGITYDREAPGVNFSTDYMTAEEIEALSSPVTVFKRDSLIEAE